MNKTCSTRNCQNPRRNGKQRYCSTCHAAWMRENRKPASQFTEFEALKHRARMKANYARRNGTLIPEPCKCGCDHVEMHHPDYTKPLEIVWICRQCHLELHENERKEAEMLECG